MDDMVSFEDFRSQWLIDITEGNPTNVELGNRFAHKIVTQWLDINDASTDLVYCDGSGDGGIDIAYLDRGEDGEGAEDVTTGHKWYLIQSKYGRAFQGINTLLTEGQKVIDTLDGKRTKLSSLAEGLLERLTTFRKNASENDQIILVFAAERALSEDEKRAMGDLRAIGRERLGPIFEVESVSIETIYKRTLEEAAAIALNRLSVPIHSNVVKSDEDLWVGSISLLDLYSFLRTYRDQTEDLDQLYEKNLRRFLGGRGKVNKGIQETLKSAPEKFGLYNNGITIVVTDVKLSDGNVVELIDPYVVNGCQTTRTIWEVCHQRLEAGGTGSNPELEEWRQKAQKGLVVTKIVKVGNDGDRLLQAITRYTNSQNAIREKDFLALTSDFQTWARMMAERYDVFLEIQRGGWDSRKALQKQKPTIKQFKKTANAFDLLKVYGSGWLGEAGIAFGKNPPFLPNGSIFKRIINQEGLDEGEHFGVEDLYAAFILQCVADGFKFGRGADRNSRRQTRFLFYMVVLDLLKEVLSRADINASHKNLSESIIKLSQDGNRQAADSLYGMAIEAIDTYLSPGDNSVFEEPAFKNTFNFDLNGFLKWEQLGKSEVNCPRFRALIAITKMYMGQRIAGMQPPREVIIEAIRE
jgi:hypothetical protein